MKISTKKNIVKLTLSRHFFQDQDELDLTTQINANQGQDI